MNKTNCDLDPLPTSLLFECIDLLIPIISFVVYRSLQTGEVPKSLKRAILNPMLKKHNLDTEENDNYRPISHLSFLSKVVEKCVYEQFGEYLDNNNLHASHQSGYRKHHSCETAITKQFFNQTLCHLDPKNDVETCKP